MSDSDQFMQSINAFVDKYQNNAETVVKVASMRILAKLVDISPVGNPELWKVNKTAREYNDAVFEHNEILKQDPTNLTPKRRWLKKRMRVNDSMDYYKPPGYTGGAFRGNWQVSFDSPAEGETGRIDKNGNMTKAVGNLMIDSFKVGMKAIYFTNNRPYAYKLEFGHSSQAPNGMIRITAEEAASMFREAIAEVKK
ncbi:hypothetical protein [Photorhabdus luminescens]|uniref:Phage protein n=1 Tax=Photorhabdus luminescens subsp. mexicana TaxID=2100167 RepID=A0A4R4IU54_PHOLU|nr:hypothetical protein [Photorhabdus luminescens]TDB44112.1 hypothetical protein C5468_23065 [Photorhabdus luminescens subsp. mexicana]